MVSSKLACTRSWGRQNQISANLLKDIQNGKSVKAVRYLQGANVINNSFSIFLLTFFASPLEKTEKDLGNS
jgi:hypothetical protein